MLLDIPYLSQVDGPGAGNFRNDCGPASVAMLLHGVGKTPTIADVYKATGVVGDQYTTGSQLIKAAAKWGLAIAGKYQTMEGLRADIRIGIPFLALVHYGAFSSLGKTESPFRGPHFLDVVGFDDKNIVVHDPLWSGQGGRYLSWPNDIFYNAWEQSRLDGNPKFWGLRPTNVTFGLVGGDGTPAIPVPQDPRYWGIGIVTASALRLRHHAPNGPTITYLANGAQVSILEPAKDGWLHIMYNGVEGWCGANPAFITVIQNPPLPPLAPPTAAPLFKDLPLDDKMKLLEALLISEGRLTADGHLLE